ncbi:FAD-binding and (Fe-S)-binding domain-containing protein [Alteromonas halophila]|uniref:D-lactate dehydrogenase (cytochrome) n=1 Tax=Alteromonas halophila TaxID=516698 RepID=A0A918JGW6_9ALTE|nr:FAD-binding and (Fe-S)-binding domain-containing protein [Alteromonas halophila]GGW79476.1 lactate dehydrogenase [Alteromonas halophila]
MTNTEQAFKAFHRALCQCLPAGQIIDDLPRRTALACDASFYALTPRLVVYIHSPQAMQSLLRLATEHGIAVTFRAAGTSLSGQAVSDSVLVMLTRDWQDAHILDQGKKIRLAPGVIGAKANTLLAPYGRKIGPDPASINACKIGGIAANNASGMCCGVKNNSYHTLAGMTLMLSDGTVLDTLNPHSVAAFRQSHATLLATLTELATTIATTPGLSDAIAHQFRLKNTMGYGLNALVDFSDPIDMLSHLMIGSEGTLGFIVDITYHTIEIPVLRATGLYLFPDIDAACALIPVLRDYQADAVELMDTRALRAVQPLLRDFYTQQINEGEVALLIDLGGDDSAQLTHRLTQIDAAFADCPVSQQPVAMCAFTDDAARINALWDIRKGLFPAVGAVRDTGTTVIIEDVAFDLSVLADGLRALTDLFSRFGYDDAIIFGHALDGNVHFVFSQGVSDSELKRYDAFMQAVVETVAGQFSGSLKAEHGTGRNMAPFLAQQWGADGVAVMQSLKTLLDPTGILNPGVILNHDPQAHVRHVKHLPAIDDIVDTCIECGFCEPACPSLHHTLSPRQRIALARRAASLSEAAQQQISQATGALSVDSCAATGMCATRCPVGINTGEWILQLRERESSSALSWQARHFSRSTGIQRLGLRATHQVSRLVGKQAVASLSGSVNRLTKGRFPYIIPTLPAPAPLPAAISSSQPDVLYIPACPNRLFGSEVSKPSLSEIFLKLCKKAGLHVRIPDGYDNTCCGQPFSSNGRQHAAHHVQQALKSALTDSSPSPDFPVVFDASTCALTAKQIPEINATEMSEYLLRYVVPKLRITPVQETVMLHVSCSSTHLDHGAALRTLTALCAAKVCEPDDIACCGFAGDKGLFRPALNASALATLRGQIPDTCRRGVSNSRTCELGLSHHGGIPYAHVAYLLDEVSAPGQAVP